MDGVNCSSTDAYGNGRYAYSARILCADHDCGYHRAISRWTVDGQEKRREIWRCSMYKKYGRKQCNAPIFRKDDLDKIMRELFSSLIPVMKESCFTLSDALHEALDQKEQINPDALDKGIMALEQKKKKLLDGWMENVVSDADYRAASQKIDTQIADLQNQKRAFENQENNTDNSMQIIRIMQKTFTNANLESTEILDELVRRFIEKIVIKPVESKETDRKKPAYIVEIWLYEAENPVFLDYSLCLRTHPNPGRRTAPSAALPCARPGA